MKIIAFDLFGTVFDLSTTPKNEIKDYINQVRREKWQPLVLPQSWECLPLHPDSLEGITLLNNRFKVVSCSNAPLDFTQRLFKNSGLLDLIEITDISVNTVYKPHPRSYLSICDQFYCQPEDVLMVTGNANSPDIQGALNVDMEAVMIRQEGCIKNIIELYKILES